MVVVVVVVGGRGQVRLQQGGRAQKAAKWKFLKNQWKLCTKKL
jgi:hypothetical protein